jgi:hypothetical protein
MKILLALTLLLASFSAQAAFYGNWAGPGHYNANGNDRSAEVTLAVSGDANTLKVVETWNKIGGTDEKFMSETTFDIKNGIELWIADLQVGFITDTSFVVDLAAGDLHIKANGNVTGGDNMTFTVDVKYDSGEYFYREANLKLIK